MSKGADDAVQRALGRLWRGWGASARQELAAAPLPEDALGARLLELIHDLQDVLQWASTPQAPAPDGLRPVHPTWLDVAVHWDDAGGLLLMRRGAGLRLRTDDGVRYMVQGDDTAFIEACGLAAPRAMVDGAPAWARRSYTQGTPGVLGDAFEAWLPHRRLRVETRGERGLRRLGRVGLLAAG